MSFKFEPYGKNQVLCEIHPAGAPGCIACYFLPYRADTAISMRLNGAADYFLTSTLTGCSVRTEGPRATPIVTHANSRQTYSRYFANEKARLDADNDDIDLLVECEARASAWAQADINGMFRPPAGTNARTITKQDYLDKLTQRNLRHAKRHFKTKKWHHSLSDFRYGTHGGYKPEIGGIVFGLRNAATRWSSYLQSTVSVEGTRKTGFLGIQAKKKLWSARLWCLAARDDSICDTGLGCHGRDIGQGQQISRPSASVPRFCVESPAASGSAASLGSTGDFHMDLTEAEIQTLASLARAEARAEMNSHGFSRSELEAGADRFWIFKEDWTGAFASLLEKGLIAGDDSGYRLTGAGRPLGAAYHAERPDQYWYYYQKFYPAALASDAHSELCRRAFGQDLTQEGMTDMAALNELLSRLALRPGERLIDLGCGAGRIAEYISDQTGAHVTGIDLAGPAIEAARARTAGKRDRLDFVVADLNALDLKPASFDAAMSLDALYWVANLEATLTRVKKAMIPGGRAGAILMQHAPDGPIEPAATGFGKVVDRLGIRYEAVDQTANFAAFWRRNYAAAQDLKPRFEAEGNGFIAESLIREAEEDFLSDIEAGRAARYLFDLRF